MQIGGRLSVCRQNKNMTQEELAYKLGITPQALSKWERGVSFPDISMLADIARLLEVSTDYLLGGGKPDPAEDYEGIMQFETCNQLRNALDVLELKFGVGMTPLFVDNRFLGKIQEMRKRLAGQGIWMPVTRLRDDIALEKQEFMILAYDNVLYSEAVETADEEMLDYMLRKLEQVVQEKYYEIISPDIVKNLVDNLRIKYPALTEGIIPEKVPYSLLTEVLKKVLARGNSAKYLPKILEAVECALYHSPEMSAEELAEHAAAEIEREDNFWVVMHKRKS